MNPAHADTPTPRAVPASHFPSTHWTLVMTASEGDPVSAQAALHQLCIEYVNPIRRALQKRGHDEHESADIAQGFIEFLLEENRLAGFERRAVRFRSFLLRCLQRFAGDIRKKEHAKKRGGGQDVVEFDDSQSGFAPDIEKTLDLEFARAIHSRAMDRMVVERYDSASKRERFAALRRFLWGNDRDVSYDEIAKSLGLSITNVRKSVFDLRQHYLNYFRDTVAQTVSHDLIDEETRYLMVLLADAEADQKSL